MIFGLFGGGGGSSTSAPDIDYETPDSLKNFINYADRNYIEDEGRAEDFVSNIYGAMRRGNLGAREGMAYINSRLSPNDSFYGSEMFDDFLNYELPNETQDQIIQGAAQTNFYRDLDSDDLSAYKVLAQSMGKTNSTADFSNFIQQRMASSLEGQNKYKTPGISDKETTMGRAIRDEDGNLTGEYAVFGMDQRGADMTAAAKDSLQAGADFTTKYLKKLRAK